MREQTLFPGFGYSHALCRQHFVLVAGVESVDGMPGQNYAVHGLGSLLTKAGEIAALNGMGKVRKLAILYCNNRLVRVFSKFKHFGLLEPNKILTRPF